MHVESVCSAVRKLLTSGLHRARIWSTRTSARRIEIPCIEFPVVFIDTSVDFRDMRVVAQMFPRDVTAWCAESVATVAVAASLSACSFSRIPQWDGTHAAVILIPCSRQSCKIYHSSCVDADDL